ncbi:histidine kinase [Spirosoma sp. HMF4905]|uniref:histidine kinase n=1 Tax=Spirosoma arboris TaxID=2682092 RepID=A0A7K1SQ08_9BACT|nr:ATP-binding protein [Spirosoma arboris]MVM35892.1 histidine kinase [Spirosoma arboris]
MPRLSFSGLLTALFLWLPLYQSWAQAVLRIDSLPISGVVLDKAWKWHLGDNPDWAKPDFDDARWDTINPTQDVLALDKLPRKGIGWLRIRLHVPPKWRKQKVGMRIDQAGAIDFFLNGKLEFQNGKISPRNDIDLGNLYHFSQTIDFDADSVQVVAIRYAFSRDKLPIDRFDYAFLYLELRPTEVGEKIESQLLVGIIIEFVLFGIFLVLGLLQLLLYAVSTEQRAARSLGLFLVTQSIVHLINGSLNGSDVFFFKLFGITNVLVAIDSGYIGFIIAIAISSVYYLLGIYQYFEQPRKTLFFVAASISLLTIPTALFVDGPIGFLPQYVLAIVIPWLEILRIGFISLKQKKTGAKLFTPAHGITLVVFIGWTTTIFLPSISSFLATNVQSLFTISFLGLALTISLLLSQERAAINKLLRKQLLDLETLSRKTIAQEQEKQQILTTQNERLEQHLRTTELNQSLTDLKATQAQLIQKEKLASLGELTAGIAHEIQNPLNFVNNFSEVSTELIDELKEGPFLKLPDSEKDYAEEILGDLTSNLQKINHHGGRASSIVKGMLEHSRTESGEKRPTDLNVLADEYLKIAYHGLKAKNKDFNCELVTDFDPALEPVEVAPQEIGRVLLNLYNNAFYAVAERGARSKEQGIVYQPAVRVTTQRSESGMEIRVKDNGTGISDVVKAKIFQPFFTTKPTGEGTGLGLSLSYDIITKGHSGMLTVESTSGEGTEFSIQLPYIY